MKISKHQAHIHFSDTLWREILAWYWTISGFSYFILCVSLRGPSPPLYCWLLGVINSAIKRTASESQKLHMRNVNSSRLSGHNSSRRPYAAVSHTAGYWLYMHSGKTWMCVNMTAHPHIYKHTLRKRGKRSSASDLSENVISQSKVLRGKGHWHPTSADHTDTDNTFICKADSHASPGFIILPQWYS